MRAAGVGIYPPLPALPPTLPAASASPPPPRSTELPSTPPPRPCLPPPAIPPITTPTHFPAASSWARSPEIESAFPAKTALRAFGDSFYSVIVFSSRVALSRFDDHRVRGRTGCHHLRNLNSPICTRTLTRRGREHCDNGFAERARGGEGWHWELWSSGDAVLARWGMMSTPSPHTHYHQNGRGALSRGGRREDGGGIAETEALLSTAVDMDGSDFRCRLLPAFLPAPSREEAARLTGWT